MLVLIYVFIVWSWLCVGWGLLKLVQLFRRRQQRGGEARVLRLPTEALRGPYRRRR